MKMLEKVRNKETRQTHAVLFGQEHWSPVKRLLASIAGVGLVLAGARKGKAAGIGMTVGGGTLLARAISNLPLGKLFGIGAGRRAIQLHKTIFVRAPTQDVFEFWMNFQNFARFMDHVQEIKVLDATHSHWKVAGPAGASVEWDTEITKLRPNELIAWRTLPGQKVEHAGIVKFEPSKRGLTKLDVSMSYTPPGGAIGHMVATLFRTDPKTAMDHDLARLKQLLERRNAPMTTAPEPALF